MKRVTYPVEDDKSTVVVFQSTPSVKRVTRTYCEKVSYLSYFNPHPLWRGWRWNLLLSLLHILYFNPHPLWRGWQQQLHQRDKMFQFQSTPSVKRVTLVSHFYVGTFLISIHTLCEEGDSRSWVKYSTESNFNPHPLWRGWRCKSYSDCLTVNISIHTLCEEGDPRQRPLCHCRTIVAYHAKRQKFARKTSKN